MRRRPTPTSPVERTPPTPASASGTATARASSGFGRAALLATALVVCATPAFAQSTTGDTDANRRLLTRTGSPKPNAARSGLDRNATTSQSLRGAVAPGRTPEPASAEMPLGGGDPLAAGDPGFDDEAATPGLVAIKPPPGATAAGGNQGPPSTGPAAPRLDPLTGRPLPAGRTAEAARGPVSAVARTGTVRDGGPSIPVAATQPRPRDILADKREEAGTEEDEFAQLGLRTGGFTWLPAIESSAGWNSNIAAKAGGTSGTTWRVAPELLGKSDWSRHALQFELRGGYLGNTTNHDYDKPTFQGAVTGRVDLGDETRVDLKGAWSHDRQAPSSADNPADTVVPATVQSSTGSIGLTRDVGLLALTLRGGIERTDYSGGTTASGASLGADVQNNTRHIGALRATWGSKSTFRPFAEVEVSTRTYDDPLVSGQPRDSTGGALRVGLLTDLGPTLRGEISTGWGIERPNRGTLPDMSGWLLDGSLVWSPTRLTTVRLTAKTAFEPTTLAASPGALGRTVGITVEHALRRDLVASAGVSLTDKAYVGVDQREDTVSLTTGLTYKFDRNIQTFIKGGYDRFTSTSSSSNYNAASIMVGLRLQR